MLELKGKKVLVVGLGKSGLAAALFLRRRGAHVTVSDVRSAEALAKEGVVVFTLGVGTPAGTEIQFLNEQGKPELVRDSRGEVVRSRLDEPTLRAIAQATHGAYYPLGPLGEGLAKIHLALENLNAGSAAAPARKLGVDRFHWFVAGVLLLRVAESLIGTRRRLRDIAS